MVVDEEEEEEEEAGVEDEEAEEESVEAAVAAGAGADIYKIGFTLNGFNGKETKRMEEKRKQRIGGWGKEVKKRKQLMEYENESEL